VYRFYCPLQAVQKARVERDSERPQLAEKGRKKKGRKRKRKAEKA